MDAFKHLAKTTQHPFGLEIDRAEGCFLFDKNGKRYLDMISGVAVSNLGHGHPAVLEAIRAQSTRHLHTMVYGEFAQESQLQLAKLLCAQLPENLQKVYFTNSGTEAIEGAMKLVKRCTGRAHFISFEGAYHGNTQGAMSLMGSETRKNAFRPLLPLVTLLPFNDEAALARINEDTAAVFIEPIQGDAGVRVPSKEFMLALRQRCTETGTLLVFDEVQTGIGRTGKLFAFQHFDVVPDVLVLGKALGGGMPIGAFVASAELMDQLSYDPALGHITTFGGHPVSCAAGAAALKAMLEEGHLPKVQAKGQFLLDKLEHELIEEKRGIGLMFALELGDPDKVNRAMELGLEEGIILFTFISCPTALRLAPPLNISEKELELACEKILNVLNRIV